MTYTATDEDGDADTLSFTITVREASTGDTSPEFPEGSRPDDLTYMVDTAIPALTLPAATGGDGTLTYSLGPRIPGLSFDPATRRLTGTPTHPGFDSMTYTVTDEDGDTDTLSFTISVEEAGEEMEVGPGSNLPLASACSDGTYVDDPDSNAALVSDCTALVGIARALAESGDLPEDHVLRQWGRGDQTKLPSWARIQVNEGRVTVLQLHQGQLAGSIPSELGGLTALTWLDLSGNQFTGAIPPEFSRLTSLSGLVVTSNEISDIAALKSVTSLTHVWLDLNRIQDISAFAGLTKLGFLDLAYNHVKDVSPLSGLTSLYGLSLDYNDVSDISALAGLTNLTQLFLSRTQIVDLSPLAGLTKLRYLWLEVNGIEDLSPLAGLTGLESLRLNANEKIVDLSPLADLTNLEELLLDKNKIRDLSPLAGLTKLEILWLDINEVEDISPLSGLSGLRDLSLEFNRIVDISPLVSNSGLGEGSEIDLGGNPLSDESLDVHVEALKARGARVLHPLKLTDEFPDSRLLQVYNDNVIVMDVEEDVGTIDVLDSMRDYASDFYHWFEDEFDYMLFLSNLSSSQVTDAFPYLGLYTPVMNDTRGTGRQIFLDNTYGSGGRLRGVIHFPDYEGLYRGPALHELLHAWANFAVPTAEGGHWGFSSANGQLGGFDIDELVELGDDRYTAGNFGTFANGGNLPPYSPIELYFAGLALPAEVPDLWVAEDGEWLDENGSPVRAADGHRVFTASNVRTYSVGDIVSLKGERDPPMVQRTHQRAAVILLINDDSRPSIKVLRELSGHANWLGMQRDDGTPLHNYFEATGGRATLSLGGLSTHRKSVPGAPTDLPASFGTPPPPNATMQDGTCRMVDLPKDAPSVVATGRAEGDEDG